MRGRKGRRRKRGRIEGLRGEEREAGGYGEEGKGRKGGKLQ